MTAPNALPATAEADADALVEYVTGFASSMLGSRRAFLPAGAAITRTGELEPFAAEPDPTASAVEMFALLLDGARQSRDDWRAVCLAIDTAHPELGDTIEFHLDFAGGSTGLVLLLPYRPGGLWREPVFGDPVTSPGPSFVYGDPSPD